MGRRPDRACSPFLCGPTHADVRATISQPMSEHAWALTGVGAEDPREMALIDESKIRRKYAEMLVPVGQTIECDGDPDAIPELRERHAGDAREDAADVKARMT